VKRDPLADVQIADARGPVETPGIEGPFDDKPEIPVGPFDYDVPVYSGLMKAPFDAPTAKEPSTVLTGESHTAFTEFSAAAQALEAHQKQGGEVLERYKSALQKLSAIAARSGG
jgi:hypothetical protein